MNGGNISPLHYERSIFISAGEQSGDLHASDLINEIKKQIPHTTLGIYGIGGDLMKQAGVQIQHHIKDLSTIGFLDVARKYSYFKRVLKECVEFVKQNKPSLIILVDYPGFNIRFAREVRKFYKDKIFYYISPQLWAWHKKRVYKIKEFVDKMLVVFPFEVEFYKSYGIEASYVGHPLVKRINTFLKENKIQNIGTGKQKAVTFLPGSRSDEIKNHMPVLIKTASILKKEYNAEINFSITPSAGNDAYTKFNRSLKDFNTVHGNMYLHILNSDLVLTKAGTSTIECALIGTPFLLFYKTFAFNYYLLKPVVRVNNLGMVNILAKENIVSEFIQKDFTVDNLVQESKRILNDNMYSSALRQKLTSIQAILGNEDASFKAAKIITSYLN